jgi:shikimate dehydrogenase
MARAWRSLAERRALAGLASAPLTVAGRDLGRAALVAAQAGPGASTLAFDRAADTVASATVVIQATTLTATGRPVPGQDRLRPGSFVLDCNYGSSAGGPSAGGPSAGGLVAAARAAGAAGAVDGVGMLLAQAAEAVTLMTGVQPDRAAMAAAVGLPWPQPA